MEIGPDMAATELDGRLLSTDGKNASTAITTEIASSEYDIRASTRLFVYREDLLIAVQHHDLDASPGVL